LRGEEATVLADVLKSSLGKDAVKFNHIGLSLVCHDKAKQRELDAIMSGFKVDMVHLGNNYYRYGHNYYIIPSSSHTFKLSFEKINGTYASENNIFQKIVGGKPLLSPYALEIYH
ncbi:unnamed protein product, partial [Allacma fusca]